MEIGYEVLILMVELTVIFFLNIKTVMSCGARRDEKPRTRLKKEQLKVRKAQAVVLHTVPQVVGLGEMFRTKLPHLCYS